MHGMNINNKLAGKQITCCEIMIPRGTARFLRSIKLNFQLDIEINFFKF